MARAPIHPGEHLAEELRELSLSAAEFARRIDVPVNRITGILNGQRGITADTALRLGHWFGMSAQFWMNLQQPLRTPTRGGGVRRKHREAAAPRRRPGWLRDAPPLRMSSCARRHANSGSMSLAKSCGLSVGA